MQPKKTSAQLDADIKDTLAARRAATASDVHIPGIRFSVPKVGPRGQITPAARGFVRLYRGGSRGGLEDLTSPTHGQWFTTDLDSAYNYAGAGDDWRLPSGAVILVVDVHGADVARMPHTENQVPITADVQEWLIDPKLLKEFGPPDVEVRVPMVVARAATRLFGSSRDVSRAKPR